MSFIISSIPMFTLGGLSVELTMLMLAILVGMVQLHLAAISITAERGPKWNAGPRDAIMPPPGRIPGRLDRAFRNFMETFPYFAAAILAATATGRLSTATALGAELYVLARIIYVPLYAFGVTGLRTLIWVVGGVGLLLVVIGVFNPAIL